MLLDHGQAEEALPHCQEAVRLEPEPGGAAPQPRQRPACPGPARRGPAPRTWRRCGSNPELAQAHAHLGLILQQEGQLDEALVWLKQAVELEPDNADVLGIPGRAARRAGGVRREPIPCWERVLALEAGSGGRAPLAWAGPCRKRGGTARPASTTDRALELQPD